MFAEFFWFIVLVAWGCRVAYLDLRTFRITNRDLGFGVLIIWPGMLIFNQEFLGLKGVVTAIICSILIGLSGLVGMGDVKLVLLFAPWLQRENWLAAILVLLTIAWVQIAFALVRDRSLPQKVAFAPAILLAVAVNMAS